MEFRHIIAVDAMGGDNAPGVVIDGLDRVADFLRSSSIGIKLFGDEAKLAPLVSKYPRVSALCEIIHTSEAVLPDDKPSRVIRSGRRTSMWMAIEAVRNQEADAVISAGNTGCLMGISKLLISTIAGIKRPAITTLLPNEKGGTSAMLDLGANSECDEDNIFQFCVIGALYARILCGIKRPSAGILNIGSEAGKGRDYLVRAASMLEENKDKLSFDYVGFVEGDDIFKGKVDVIATDGFSGNIALKTLEGTAKFITSSLKMAMRSSFLAKLGALLMLPQLKKFKSKMDPRNYNGAVFLGLNGIVVKSHGGTDAVGFSQAVRYAAMLIDADFNSKVRVEMEKISL
jgi:glycerol-3-phosphate acyltransferase PlsX